MNLGAHNEAVWIEGVKHAADHAAHEFRRQWMRRQISFGGATRTHSLRRRQFLAGAGGAPASRLDHVRRPGGHYDASAAQPAFRLRGCASAGRHFSSPYAAPTAARPGSKIAAGRVCLPGRKLLGDDLAIAGATQLIDHRAMTGVDGVAADTRLACERGNGQTVGSLLQFRVWAVPSVVSGREFRTSNYDSRRS